MTGAVAMDEPETIYTAILTAEYRDEQAAFDVDIRYTGELPPNPPANQGGGLYPIRELAIRLETGDAEPVFTHYSIHQGIVDGALKDVLEKSDSEVTHWTEWLEDEGYDEFVHVFQDVTNREDETYLLASRAELPAATIRDEAHLYLHDFREQREREGANRSRWRSY